MNIKKISLKGAGFKGAEVTYLREEEKNGRPFINEVVEKRKHPIHLGLETMFKDLRFYLLDITGMLRGDEDKNTKDYTILESEVVSIEFNAGMFCITGEKRVFADKVVKLKTPKVDDKDQYEHFDTVQKMIEAIVEETKEYLAGTKKVDDVEVAVRWVQGGHAKDVTEDQLKAMTPEQLKKFATELLENNFGAVVMMNDDFASSVDVDVEEALEGVKEDDVKEDEVVIDAEEVMIPAFKSVAPKKKEKKAIEKALDVPPQGDPVVLNSSDNNPAF